VVDLSGKKVTITAPCGMIDSGVSKLNLTQTEGDLALSSASDYYPIFHAENVTLKNTGGKVELENTSTGVLTDSNLTIEAAGDISLKSAKGITILFQCHIILCLYIKFCLKHRYSRIG